MEEEKNEAINKTAVKTQKTDKYTSVKGLNTAITVLIGAVFFLCPMFFTGYMAQGLGFEKMTLFYFLVLLGVVLWVTKGVISGELNIKRTPLDLPLLAVIVIFSISSILSVSGKDSVIGSYGGSAKGLVATIVFILFYYLVVNNIDGKRIKTYYFAFLSSASLIIVYSLLQLLGVHFLPMAFTKAISFNPLGSASALSIFIIIALPLLIVATAQIKEIFPRLSDGATMALKIVSGAVVLAGLVVLSLLSGFTFWPIAIVGIVIVLMFFLAKIIRITNNNLLIPLVAFLIMIIFLVLGNFNIMNLKLPAEVSLSRSASWHIAENSIKENPFFGSGPATFYYNFSKFKTQAFNNTPLWNVRFDGASGNFFELLATVGILGALAVLIAGLIALSIIFLTLIKTERKEGHSLLLGLFAAFVSASLFAMLFAENNALILTTVLIFVMSVASAFVMYPERFKTLKLSFRASPKYALALAAVFLCVSAGVVVLFTIGLKLYIADYYAGQSLLTSNNNTKISYLQKSIALAPYQDSYYLGLANSYMAIANQKAVSNGNQADIINNLNAAIADGRKAIEISPNSAANNEAVALIYENASFYTRGALEWAENLYNKEIELDPQNPTPHLRLALVNMARANAETEDSEKQYDIGEAIKKYDDAIALKADFAAAYYGKAIADERLNNLDDAIEQLKNANIVSANNADYLFELGRLYFNRGVTKQPNLSQTAAEEIAESDLLPNGASSTTEELSVKPSQPAGGTIARNNDINAAEQIFLSILAANKNHANALYSLAVLYQKIGENDKARAAVNQLLSVIKDQSTKDAIEQQFAPLLQ